MRVSRVTITLVTLDQYDALFETQPAHFNGDADGTALEKAAEWLAKLPETLAAQEPPEEETVPDAAA